MKKMVFLLSLFTSVGLSGVANAAAPTDKDAQIILRTLGFFEPAVTGDVGVAVVYGGGVSKAEAEAIAQTLSVSGSKGKILALATNDLSGAKIVFVPDGYTDYAPVEAATKAGKITLDKSGACMNADKCVLSIVAEPKVQITVAPVALAASGLKFNSSFKMMITEKK